MNRGWVATLTMLLLFAAGAVTARADVVLWNEIMVNGGLGGVSTAVCGWDASGLAWVVTGSGPGEDPAIDVWLFPAPGVGPILVDHGAVYDLGFRGGVHVTCHLFYGFVNGVLTPQLLVGTGPGPGGGAHSRVWVVRPGF